MKHRWLSIASILVVTFLWASETQILAEEAVSSQSQTVDERLSAIEGKLRSLESRLDQALQSGEQKMKRSCERLHRAGRRGSFSGAIRVS